MRNLRNIRKCYIRAQAMTKTRLTAISLPITIPINVVWRVSSILSRKDIRLLQKQFGITGGECLVSRMYQTNRRTLEGIPKLLCQRKLIKFNAGSLRDTTSTLHEEHIPLMQNFLV
ncbi:hypothetical protein I7I53_07896 [Histoplasma capsulatum var. duboisii H88]|uniref:Uncharacterized protein n=1 Tax=Ajellomyces capsulatus (strain H88) TaxID=544711 RepID=A0A8A1LJX7_AJEC8|nr:hypothetical protein I7I53_07896 [Histoplasma capsulatum var. duboisii H88]